ncbi:uncharacterized protein METZ01_LOCUS244801, partial [marine metagenome]
SSVGHIVFRPKGTERVRIQADGNVGIGTTAPADDLHVYGSGNVALLESSSVNVWLQMKGSTTYSWQIGTTDKGLQFYNDETSAYRVVFKKDGNVGIGTTLPAAQLHVGNGNHSPSNTMGSPGVFIENSGNSNTYTALQVKTGGGLGLVVTNAGKVGIGTATPAKALDVRASASWDGIHIGSTAGSATSIDFARSTTHANPTARIGVAEPAATHTSDMRFYTSDASGSAPNLVEKMRIDQNGKVGIGTTSPHKLLSVREATAHVLINSSSDASGNYAALRFKVDSQDNDTRQKGAIFFQRTDIRGVGSLHFATHDGGNPGGSPTSDANVEVAHSRMSIDHLGTQNHKGNPIVNSASIQGLQDGAIYDFDGTSSDYMTLASDTTFSTGAYTISAWIKSDDTTHTYIQNIVGYVSNNVGHFSIHTNGKLGYWSYGGSGWRFGNTVLTDDKWHHAVMVYDG